MTKQFAWTLALVAGIAPGVAAQRGGRGQGAPPTGRAAAPVDLTGYWVSVVTEDWRFRMVTPPKGDYASVPISQEGRRVADTWDPSKDGMCEAYGAAGLMRMPGRLHITWEDDTTLKIEADAGQQTRLLHFGAVRPPSGERTLQGYSTAQWVGGAGGPLGGFGGFGGNVVAPDATAPGRGQGALRLGAGALEPAQHRVHAAGDGSHLLGCITLGEAVGKVTCRADASDGVAQCVQRPQGGRREEPRDQRGQDHSDPGDQGDPVAEVGYAALLGGEARGKLKPARGLALLVGWRARIHGQGAPLSAACADCLEPRALGKREVPGRDVAPLRQHRAALQHAHERAALREQVLVGLTLDAPTETMICRNSARRMAAAAEQVARRSARPALEVAVQAGSLVTGE